MEENRSENIQEAEVIVETKKSNKSMFIVGLVAVALVVFVFFQKNDEDNDDFNRKSNNTTEQVMTKEVAFGNYKDGVYEVKGDYVSPGGSEQIDVKLTVKDNVVSGAEVVSLAERPISKKFQGEFVAGFKEFVVGKKIDEINVTKVSGSSLTSKGFRDALNKIRTQAKV